MKGFELQAYQKPATAQRPELTMVPCIARCLWNE